VWLLDWAESAHGIAARAKAQAIKRIVGLRLAFSPMS
jgi:hypothetical protein